VKADLRARSARFPQGWRAADARRRLRARGFADNSKRSSNPAISLENSGKWRDPVRGAPTRGPAGLNQDVE
jgi:hypothetical protein